MLVSADIVGELGDALSFAFGMFWEILWALILGFALSAVVQAVVSTREMRRLLPDNSPRSSGLCPRCRIVVLLLRGGRARPFAVPQGR
jgi:uncharacterized membrane protein YraQ (UPF0718 family)